MYVFLNADGFKAWEKTQDSPILEVGPHSSALVPPGRRKRGRGSAEGEQSFHNVRVRGLNKADVHFVPHFSRTEKAIYTE